MTGQTWFTLRGEQYQYDGKWWRKLKVGEQQSVYQFKRLLCDGWNDSDGRTVNWSTDWEYRVPCSQPFRVGDRVKVVRVKKDNPEPVYQCIGLDGEIDYLSCSGSLKVKTDAGTWYFDADDIEPAPSVEMHPGHDEPDVPVDPGEAWELYVPMKGEKYSDGTEYKSKVRDSYWRPDASAGFDVRKPCNDIFIYRLPKYTPPAGWRVKCDDEVVARGDAFSHTQKGNMHPSPIWCFESTLGKTVKHIRAVDMPRGGYILSPIATDQPNVDTRLCLSCSDELCALDDDPNGDSNATCARCRAEEDHDFDAEPDVKFNRDGSLVETDQPDVSQELQNEDTKPLDICLTYMEQKVKEAAKDKPDVLDKWRAIKVRLAGEMAQLIGGAK